MKPGIYLSLSYEDYSQIPAISKSGLDQINKSPLHYWSRYLDPNRVVDDETPAKRRGKATHYAVFEPEEFKKRYVRQIVSADVKDVLITSDELSAELEKIYRPKIQDIEKARADLIASRSQLATKILREIEDFELAMNKELGELQKTILDKETLIADTTASLEGKTKKEISEAVAPIKELLANLKNDFKTKTKATAAEISELEAKQKAFDKDTTLLVKDLDAQIKELEKMIGGTKASKSETLVSVDLSYRERIWDLVLANFMLANTDKEILTQADYDQIMAMREAIYRHPAARALVSGEGSNETSLVWIDPITGELSKGRVDRLRKDHIIPDLKTTRDASPEGFQKAIVNYRYHVQASFYHDGYEILTGIRPRIVFIAVESEPPYAVGVYVCTEKLLEAGRTGPETMKGYRENMRDYAAARKSDKWNGYPDTIGLIDLPEWYYKRIDYANG